MVGLPRPIHESIKTLKQVSDPEGTFGLVWSQVNKVRRDKLFRIIVCQQEPGKHLFLSVTSLRCVR